MTRTLVIMGPAGAGKSTVGAAAAALLGVRFYEGDDFHPPENVAKIRSGEGLSNADRKPWIEAIGVGIANDAPNACVLACSALNVEVRAMLLRALPGELTFVLIDVPEAELLRRLSTRERHFAGPDLLNSQLAAMDAAAEVPRVNGQQSPDRVAEDAVALFLPAQ